MRTWYRADALRWYMGWTKRLTLAQRGASEVIAHLRANGYKIGG